MPVNLQNRTIDITGLQPVVGGPNDGKLMLRYPDGNDGSVTVFYESDIPNGSISGTSWVETAHPGGGQIFYIGSESSIDSGPDGNHAAGGGETASIRTQWRNNDNSQAAHVVTLRFPETRSIYVEWWQKVDSGYDNAGGFDQHKLFKCYHELSGVNIGPSFNLPVASADPTFHGQSAPINYMTTRGPEAGNDQAFLYAHLENPGVNIARIEDYEGGAEFNNGLGPGSSDINPVIVANTWAKYGVEMILGADRFQPARHSFWKDDQLVIRDDGVNSPDFRHTAERGFNTLELQEVWQLSGGAYPGDLTTWMNSIYIADRRP